MKLENLHTYILSMNIGEKVWKLVNNWDTFSKETIGKKLVMSIDSIACSLSKSCGNNNSSVKNDVYFSIDSLIETKTLITKAAYRNLISEKDYNNLSTEINMINYFLKKYIKSVNKGNTYNKVKIQRIQ